jgi:hypothetical protein
MALNEDDKQWIEAVLEALENRLMERMRDMQTELLRGFEAYSRPMGVRMAKLEADQRNLEASTAPRLAQLEQQITDLTLRVIKLEGEQR